jgi:hypothetical protein
LGSCPEADVQFVPWKSVRPRPRLALLFRGYAVHDAAMRRSRPAGNDWNAPHGNARDAATPVMTALVAIVAMANDDAVDGPRRANPRGAGERLGLHCEDAERHSYGKP